MVTQTLAPKTIALEDDRGSGRFDIRSIPTPTVYIHIITLIHRATRHEVSFKVETMTDRFKVVLDEITYQKVERGLFGYEIFEVLDCNDPF